MSGCECARLRRENERLLSDLARAWGMTVAQTRWDVLGRAGSGDWLEPLGDPEDVDSSERPVSGAVSGTSAPGVHRPATEQTPRSDT